GHNFLSSLIRVLIGFSAGSIAGLFIGIMMGWNNLANKALNPIISLIYPIPARARATLCFSPPLNSLG
ncbi:unnamed protein product, partial [marine sediment metagenome]